MGIRHLFGFVLTMAGAGVCVLALIFTINNQTFNKDFLLALGSFATIVFFVGVLLLNSDK